MTETTATSQIAVGRRAAPTPHRPYALLATVLTAQAMAVIDNSIVNVATPVLHTNLHASGAALQLIVAGYTIAYAVLLVTGARFGDRIGHGRAFQAGLVMFTLASLACGLSPDAGGLIGFRVVQGVGAALMIPQVLSLIQHTFAGEARLRAISMYSAVIACGAGIGQVVGGVLTSADLFGTSWRPVFVINVPIGLVAYVISRRTLPPSRGERGRSLDLAGLLTLSPAVLALVVPLVLGHDEHWPAWCWALLAASVPLAALFVAVERRTDRRGGEPLVPGRLVGARHMPVSLLALVCIFALYGGWLFAVALYTQEGLGFSPAVAGVSFLAPISGFAIVSLTWRRLPARFWNTTTIVGFLLTALGNVATALVVRDGADHHLLLELALAPVGIGMAAAVNPLMALAIQRVPTADASEASGLLVTTNQLALVVGVATFGTLFLTLAADHRVHAIAHAEVVTSIALAGIALVGAALATVLARGRRA
jgi:MFS family permease